VPKVVVAGPVGGWSSFEAMKPYLNSPTEDVINDAFDEVEVV